MLMRLLRRLVAGDAPLRRTVSDDVVARERAVKLHRDGRLSEAETAYRTILAQTPDDAVILGLLGHCLTAQGRHDVAVAVLSRAVALDSNSAETLFNLASALKATGANARALGYLQQAIQVTPGFIEAHIMAAEISRLTGDYDGADAHFCAALLINPNHAEAHYNFGIHLYNLGNPREAVDCFRRALESKPEFALAHGNLVAVSSAVPGYKAADIFREQKQWARMFADPLTPSAPQYRNVPEESRRLRVGYVSPDFWKHPVSNFFEPVLEHHDRGEFDVYCYDTGRVDDDINRRLRTLADVWIDCAALSDDDLARRIGDDRIDILVDLSAHTKNNRLAVFARRPAPVQVSYLGYPTSTGMAAIDYRISDPVLDPDGAETFSVERVARLPHTYFCFRPPPELPAVGPLSALAAGYVTFGSFNNMTKLNAETIERWSAVLSAVPGSKLFVKTKSLEHVQMRKRLTEAFAGHGIAGSRLVLRGWEAETRHHLDHYNEVDIALDPAPYNGVTTTCEALLMGVPVVVLRGDTHLSRMGASLLRAAGLPQLIVETPKEYVEKCVSLADDLAALAALRSQLRERMQTSAVMDEAGFTRALEREYRTMWQTWCRRPPQTER